MTARKPVSRWREGRLDPDWLGQAGLRFVEGWLRERLEGRDPYQPIDQRVDEDPEAFVVQLLKDVGAQHASFTAISASVLSLLDAAKKKAKPPAYFQRLLRLCQLVPLPHVQAWFDDEVRLIANGKHSRWNEGTCQSILYAATMQQAGAKESWLILLAQPAYSTLALLSLGRTFRERLEYLRPWWVSTDGTARDLELDQILRTGLRELGTGLLKVLTDARDEFPDELWVAVEGCLREQGGVMGSERSPRTSAIRNAGFKREYLLGDVDAA